MITLPGIGKTTLVFPKSYTWNLRSKRQFQCESIRETSFLEVERGGGRRVRKKIKRKKKGNCASFPPLAASSYIAEGPEKRDRTSALRAHYAPASVYFWPHLAYRDQLGSFSIDDGSGSCSENVRFKMNSRFFSPCRVYSNLLKMASVGELPWSWFLEDRTQV